MHQRSPNLCVMKGNYGWTFESEQVHMGSKESATNGNRAHRMNATTFLRGDDKLINYKTFVADDLMSDGCQANKVSDIIPKAAKC